MKTQHKNIISNIINNGTLIQRIRPATGFYIFSIFDNQKQHRLTVWWNQKYNQIFIHSSQDKTIAEAHIPNTPKAHISTHQLDVLNIARLCAEKAKQQKAK